MSFEDDIFAQEPSAEDPAGRRRGDDRHDERHDDERERVRRRRGGCAVLAMVLAAVLVVGAVVVSFSSLGDLIPGGGSDTEDYDGPGSGQVEVVVAEGESGADIGTTLHEQNVVASVGAFSNAATAQPDLASAIQPGTYQMKEEMAAEDALQWLADPANRVAQGITIREGLWRSEIYVILAEANGRTVEQYEAAERSSDLQLPEEAEGDIEGWLFPATYEFDEGATPVQQLNAMIEKTVAELESANVPRSEWERTLTVASIVEGEAGAADREKVARVVENRLEDTDGPTVGMLNMDSTVHYIFQERGRAGTTDEMRASDDPYNTYQHTGLPPGPINNPGAAAIEAAASPAEGDWLFFVTVNPDTGETKFATTQAEHDQNVQEFTEWCDANRDEDGNC